MVKCDNPQMLRLDALSMSCMLDYSGEVVLEQIFRSWGFLYLEYRSSVEDLSSPTHFLWSFSCAAIFDNTGRYVITGSDDRLVKIWSTETGLCLRSCRGHEVFPYS